MAGRPSLAAASALTLLALAALAAANSAPEPGSAVGPARVGVGAATHAEQLRRWREAHPGPLAFSPRDLARFRNAFLRDPKVRHRAAPRLLRQRLALSVLVES
jgi:hypothetical protein